MESKDCLFLYKVNTRPRLHINFRTRDLLLENLLIGVYFVIVHYLLLCKLYYDINSLNEKGFDCSVIYHSINCFL